MPFAFSNHYIEEYRTLGYTVFRQVVPPTLLADLRRSSDTARSIARRQNGPQSQRLQPVKQF